MVVITTDLHTACRLFTMYGVLQPMILVDTAVLAREAYFSLLFTPRHGFLHVNTQGAGCLILWVYFIFLKQWECKKSLPKFQNYLVPSSGFYRTNTGWQKRLLRLVSQRCSLNKVSVCPFTVADVLSYASQAPWLLVNKAFSEKKQKKQAFWLINIVSKYCGFSFNLLYIYNCNSDYTARLSKIPIYSCSAFLF